MKILCVNKFFYPKGGAERVFFDTKSILESHGHETIDFAMRHPMNESSPYEKYFVDEVEFKSVGGAIKAYANIYSIEAKRRLEALIVETRPDIAHLHNAYFQISPSIFSVFKKYKIPVAYTVHDYHLICPNYKLFTKNQVCERCRGHKYYNAILNRCQDESLIKSVGVSAVMTINKLFGFYEKGVDQFIAPSRFLKNTLVSWGFCSENQVSVIPLSVDLEVFSDRVGAQSREYILFFGRFSHEKGIEVLLRATELLPNIPIVLMGDGPMRMTVEKMIRDKPWIRILPYQKDPASIARIISQAVCVVVPSVWYENYPMSVIEALSCKTPVIASHIGGIPEQIIDGRTGFTFEPHDYTGLAFQIKKLYENPEVAHAMGERARSFVERENNREVYYRRLIELYENLLGKRSAQL